ncbi:MAG: glycosyltransferase [Leptolyngbyaceae cyanobacterium SM1_1_3]|nr:glycosyltransferase [Leptolyngbyaceae cyanobacterium SM1_1_3]NJN01330.1 glycosyltransferase [Leptolyngbyaceae cyanobacterium RM1_1_2]NJO09907.1 glycosyltransferase [Leptolyngbyaceae cyanobacterium SL_1_1]
MRLLVVLYAGDYREAYDRMKRGQSETYHGHRYALNTLIGIGKQVEEVAVLCCYCQEPYNELAEPGFRVIGTGFSFGQPATGLIPFVEAQAPTHLVIRSPTKPLLQWAIKKQIPTLVLLADSFNGRSLKDRLKNYLLARLLNHSCIDWVGNHGINACKSLVAIGVNPHKIVPWDWPHQVTPEQFPAKKLPANADFWKLTYVGSVSEAKGVGDIIEAVALLRAKGIEAKLKIAGKGKLKEFEERAIALGIQDNVSFLGLVPHDSIVDLMRSADFVIVPSRHDYPEGLPLTIYEGLCSRTPIIASDHPMFLGNLVHRKSAMIYPAGQVEGIVTSIETLISEASLYEEISAQSEQTWQNLQIPVKSGDFISKWLLSSDAGKDWLSNYSIAARKYSNA